MIFNTAPSVNAWLKWERAEDKNCYAAIEAAGTNGCTGSIYFDAGLYVRLNLIRCQDECQPREAAFGHTSALVSQYR